MIPFCDSNEGGDQEICSTLGLRGLSDIPNGDAIGTDGREKSTSNKSNTSQ